jgi:hypothetical protein
VISTLRDPVRLSMVLTPTAPYSKQDRQEGRLWHRPSRPPREPDRQRPCVPASWPVASSPQSDSLLSLACRRRPCRQVHFCPAPPRHGPPSGVDPDALDHLARQRRLRRHLCFHHCPSHPLLRPGACSFSCEAPVPSGRLTTYQPPIPQLIGLIGAIFASFFCMNLCSMMWFHLNDHKVCPGPSGPSLSTSPLHSPLTFSRPRLSASRGSHDNPLLGPVADGRLHVYRRPFPPRRWLLCTSFAALSLSFLP